MIKFSIKLRILTLSQEYLCYIKKRYDVINEIKRFRILLDEMKEFAQVEVHIRGI